MTVGTLNTNQKTFSFISNLMIGFSAFAFLALYFVLSFYNRPVNDDVTWSVILQDKNLFEFTKYFYETWDGRWASVSCFFIVFAGSNAFINIHYFMFIYYCFTFILLIYSVNTILRFCLLKLFNYNLTKTTSITFSLLFIAGFYYFTFQNIEVWWWFAASIDYLQGIVVLLFGTALIIKQQKNVIHYILIALSFIYFGGAFEIYILIAGAFFIFVCFYFLRKNKTLFSLIKNSLYYKGIVVALISVSISAVINFTAPGNYLRREAQTNVDSSPGSFLLSHASFSMNIGTFAQKKYAVALSLASVWLLLGMRIKRNPLANKSRKLIKHAALLLFVALALSIIITMAFQVIILPGYVIPSRGWTFTSFVGFVVLCFLFLLIGYSLSIKNSIVAITLGILLPLACSVMVTGNLVQQYKYASRFAKEYDNLIISLIEAKNKKISEPLELPPLPDSGSLNYLFMNNGMTSGLEKLLDLDYKIKVTQEVN